MPSITSSQEATMLQLQYIANSSGLRRSYLETQFPEKENDHVRVPGVHRLPSTYIKQVTDNQSRPDIAWHPSYQTYLKRVEKLAASSVDRPKAVPEKFPIAINSPRVWSGSEFEDPSKYIIEFSAEDIVEIEAGLAYFKALPGDFGPDDVSQETFPLTTLSQKLHDVALTLHFGLGFSVLRGLNPKKYSPLDNILLYLGITSYIAETRGAQDYDGRMIVHIKDMEKDLPPATRRSSPYSSRAQPFHNDRCDILAMYALDVAGIGGESLLASSGKIYNEIAATRPDVIHVLADDQWIFDDFVTPAKWQTGALLFEFEEHGPSFCYSRRPLTGAPFFPHVPGVPAMTEIQAEALDMVHFTAKKHQLSIQIQRGDIEIINNLGIFHAREGFVDDRSHRRHFLRLWLKNEKMAWKTPEKLSSQTAELYKKSGLDAPPRWDIDRAPFVPRVITRHMRCS